MTKAISISLLAAIAHLFCVPTSVAQGIQLSLTIVDSARGTPIPSALIELRADSQTVRSALTTERGTAAFQALTAGSYAIRVKRIGYGPLTRKMVIAPGSPWQSQTFAMAFAPVALTSYEVRADDRCERPSSPAAVALWDDIRVALTANHLTQAAGALPLRITEFEREVRGGRIVGEERVVGIREFAGQPFVSDAPDSIAFHGFVYPLEEDALHFVAPDAALLTSASFVASHCFNVEEKTQGRLGLAFEPDRLQRKPDIAGTLWVDPKTRVLQSLDFSYLRIGRGLDGYGLGGRTEFSRAGSAWIVSNWYVRMPHLSALKNAYDEARAALRAGTSSAFSVRGLWDKGGRATMQPTSSARALAVVNLSVFDSTVGEPLRGARLQIGGQSDILTTDADGRAYVSLPANDTVTFVLLHEKRAFMPDGGVVRVVVQNDATPVAVSIPSATTIANLLCPSDAPRDSAAIVGLTHNTNGRLLGDTEVRARWSLKPNVVREELSRSGAQGQFALCGLASHVALSVRATADGETPHVLSPGGLGTSVTLETAERRWMELIRQP